MVSLTPTGLGTAGFYDVYFTAFYYVHVLVNVLNTQKHKVWVT